MIEIEDAVPMPDALRKRGRQAIEGGPTAEATKVFNAYAKEYMRVYRVELEMQYYDQAEKLVKFGKKLWPFGQRETVSRLRELTKQLEGMRFE